MPAVAGRSRTASRPLRDLIERLKQLARSLGEDPATRARGAARPPDRRARGRVHPRDARARRQDGGPGAPDRRPPPGRQPAGERSGERLDELRRKLDDAGPGDRSARQAPRAGRSPAAARRRGGRRPQGASRARPPPGPPERRPQRARRAGAPDARPPRRRCSTPRPARPTAWPARPATWPAASARRPAASATRPQHAAELKALADAQRALEDDARRFALDVNPDPRRERPVATSTSRRSARPSSPSSAATSTRRVSGSSPPRTSCGSSARDIEDLPTDPKSLAYRLVRRQDALNGDLADAQNKLREKDKLNKDEKAALADRLKSLGRRQETIAKLAASIKPPERPLARGRFPEHAAREAADKTRRAAEAFAQPTAQVLEERKNEARQALDRLGNELPDWWRRTEPTRQKFDEARRTTNELFNQVQQHLRETEPTPRPSGHRREGRRGARQPPGRRTRPPGERHQGPQGDGARSAGRAAARPRRPRRRDDGARPPRPPRRIKAGVGPRRPARGRGPGARGHGPPRTEDERPDARRRPRRRAGRGSARDRRPARRAHGRTRRPPHGRRRPSPSAGSPMRSAT